MNLHRRNFTRVAGGTVAALLANPRGIFGQPPVEANPPADSLPAPRFLLSWGTNGTGPGQFDVPIAIAITPKDEILIADFRQTNAEVSRVQRFDASGKLLGAFELEPMPGGLALDAEGLIYASHMMRHKITVRDAAGKLVREFGKQGAGPGEFDQPGGIAFGPDGSLYVADQVNRRVQRLSPRGEPISAWGKYGVMPGEFGGDSTKNSRGGGPHFLAFNRAGELYTTEASVGRVQRFTADGKFLSAFGDNETGPGHFGGNKSLQGPIGVAVDAQNQVWITSSNHRVQQFTPEGRYQRGIGEGSEPGQVRLPHGLAFDSQNHLYVVDSRNSRIQKFAL